MDCHQNVRLTMRSRERLAGKVLLEGCTLKQA
ncbi:MAG: IS481 family transposase, partial [Acidobacteriaceae bacterium]